MPDPDSGTTRLWSLTRTETQLIKLMFSVFGQLLSEWLWDPHGNSCELQSGYSWTWGCCRQLSRLKEVNDSIRNVCIVLRNLMEIVLLLPPLLLVYNWLLLFWQADRLWLPPQYSNTTGCTTNLNSVNNPTGPFHRPALAMTMSLLTLIWGRKGLSFSGREVELNVFQMSNFQIFFLTFAVSLSREWSSSLTAFKWTLSEGGLDRNENKS